MGGLLFVSQAMLDSWAEQGRIDFVGHVMTLLSGEGKGRKYALEPAIRFLAVLGAESDPNGLVRKVKSTVQLKELGAEAVDDSCILGDTAYQVEPGFLAEVEALQAAATAQATKAAAAAPPAPVAKSGEPAGAARSQPLGSAPMPKDLEAKRKEAEALARFLLENLS